MEVVREHGDAGWRVVDDGLSLELRVRPVRPGHPGRRVGEPGDADGGEDVIERDPQGAVVERLEQFARREASRWSR